MRTTEQIAAARTIRQAESGLSWGLVPTMGYLHKGHLALVRRARAENKRVAVTIYVNPTQFSPNEDLDTYPRDQERDLQLLAAEGVDLVFMPGDETMYPAGFQTYITVEKLSRLLEGSARPTHFRGVATIVTKLFNILRPTRAYFGQKDAQQTVVVRRLIQDLNLDVELVICPTVREADGLALSSRNARLSPAAREQAPILYHALQAAEVALDTGKREGNVLRQVMLDRLKTAPLARPDYVSVAHPDTLAELERVEDQALLSMAVFFGAVRLIDNLLVTASKTD